MSHAPPPKALSRRRKWLFRLLALTVIPALFFLLLEAGLRLGGYGVATGFFLPTRDGAHVMTNPRFGWRFFPPAIAREPVVLQLARTKPKDVCRVFILGGSAAMGYPDPSYNVGRVLEVMLRRRYPGVTFEVINAAMTAINSHVVRLIADDCAARQPDVFVIYLGNNEVVGPFGPGTTFAGFSPSLAGIRTSLWLQSTRTGQLLDGAGAAMTSAANQPDSWRGMEMFLDKLVSADDPRLARTYEHFRANLQDTVTLGRDAGAVVLLCTVATNVRDNPPFASRHRTDLAADAQARWQALVDEGVSAESAGDGTKAIAPYEAALKVDDRYADLHFRLARRLDHAGQFDEAKRHYVQARDLDALRFRADTAINDAIRQVAKAMTDEGVALVDAEHAFEASDLTEHGLVGQSLFHEHVHMNFAGTYVLAQAIFESLAPRLPERVSAREDRSARLPTSDECKEALALSPWDQQVILADVRAITARPPFTNQIDHASVQAQRDEEARLAESALTPDAMAQSQAMYAQAIAAWPEDLVLRQKCASLQTQRGQFQEAIAQLNFVIDKFPEHRVAHNSLGLALTATGKVAEARMHYEEALRLYPPYADAHNNLGMLLAAQGQTDEAIAHYRQALQGKADYAPAHYNLAIALKAKGQVDEAIAQLKQAVTIRPDFHQAQNNLANILQTRGQLDEAIEHYRAALAAKPDYIFAHCNLGIALRARGQIDEAIRHFELALKYEPNYADARRELQATRARQNGSR